MQPAEPTTNMVFVNVSDGTELMQVITGYKQQKILLEQKIAELPEAKVPRGLVSVRTIDDSPSHQAEFVICDLVRNSGPRFLIEHQRLADILHAKGSTALSSLKDYLKNRNAIIKAAGWNILCNMQNDICGICQGEHAGQRCPEIANASGASLETFCNIPPLDDVSRAAFSSIKLGKVADSVKKLKLQRKQQREDANANAYAYAQQMRQTTTDYEDYIRARGSAQAVSETIAGLIDEARSFTSRDAIDHSASGAGVCRRFSASVCSAAPLI
ncbi:hypothetical protein Trihar35433_9662 [Trichoderma harzianum]|nr:hypothetical protein Trihar35433_9662 [Trichoderma harzianum]